jgi:type III pantothenate kinase
MDKKMLFVIDIGNTNIVAAFMESASEVKYSGRMATVKTAKSSGIASGFEDIIRTGAINKDEISGVIISSVVPEITDEAKEAARLVTGLEALVLTYKTETGVVIGNEAPENTGADLIAAAAGAAKEYGGPIAIFDLGTATTLTVVTADRIFLGGLIIPGVRISLDAMVGKASQLPAFDIAAPKRFIGRNTVESMQSGIVYGNAAMMDALIDRTEDDLGQKVTALVTGGLGGLIYPYCRRKMIYEPDLVLKGLWYIYEMNCA